MTNYEWLKTLTLDQLCEAKIITACGYCAYLTDGCQRGQWCIEGHKLWLAREREGKLTNREAYIAWLSGCNSAQLAEWIARAVFSENRCDRCPASDYCQALESEIVGDEKKLSMPCKAVVALWLDEEAE